MKHFIPLSDATATGQFTLQHIFIFCHLILASVDEIPLRFGVHVSERLASNKELHGLTCQIILANE